MNIEQGILKFEVDPTSTLVIRLFDIQYSRRFLLTIFSVSLINQVLG